MPPDQLAKRVAEMKQKMHEHARNLEFEEAARLRDKEKKLQESLEEAKTEWERKAESEVHDVTVKDISEVVAMMTGILMAVGGLGSLVAATPLALLSSSIGWRRKSRDRTIPATCSGRLARSLRCRRCKNPLIPQTEW